MNSNDDVNKSYTREEITIKVKQIVSKYLDDNTIYVYDNPMPDKGVNHLIFTDIIADIENEFEISLNDISDNVDQDFYSLKILLIITENIVDYICGKLDIK